MGGKVEVTTGPKGVEPVAEQPKPIRVTDPVELAKLPNAADALKQSDIPEIARAYLGGGDAKKAPKELVALFGDLRFRLPDTATAPSFSPDGKRLLVACKEQIHVLDAATGLITRSIPAPYWDNRPAAAVLAPDNRTLATGTHRQVELWDLETGKRLHLLKIDDDDPRMWMAHLAFSPDGKHLAAGCWLSNQVRVWDVDTGRMRLWWDGTTKDRPWGGVNQVSFSADGNRLVVIDRDNKLLCWDIPAKGDLKATAAPAGYPAVCNRICFSADGQVVAFQNPDKEEIVVRDTKGERLGSWSVAAPLALTFTRDSRTLLALQADAQHKPVVRRWEVGTRKLLADVEIPAFEPKNPCAFSPDGRTLAVIPNDHDSVVRLVDTTTGKYLHPDPGPTQAVHPLIFSPEGTHLAALDGYRGYLWNLSTRELVRSWNAEEFVTFAFHPSGKVLAFASKTGVVLETTEGRPLHNLEGPKKMMEQLAFSPDGKMLAAAGYSDNVWVWNTNTGKLAHVLEQHEPCEAIAFSHDGRFLYTSVGKEFHLKAWNLSTGKEQFTGGDDLLAQVLAVRADGKTVAVLDFDTGYRLMDGKTGACTKPLFLPPELHCDEMPGAIAPGGEWVAVSTSTGSLVLWQPEEGQNRYRVIPLGSGRGTRLSALNFSPDGRYVAVGQRDGTIAVLRLSEKGQLPEVRVTSPTASELAERPNAADALKHEDVPEAARAYVGGGDAKKAPPELVAVLGDMAFRATDIPGPLAYSPDGKLLAAADVGSRGRVWIFDAKTGRLLRQLATGRDLRDLIAFSPNGKRLAGCGFEDPFSVIDAETGRLVWKLEDTKLPGGVDRFAFSEDGKRIMLSSKLSSVLEEHDAQTGKLIHAENTGADPVRDFAYSADGTKFVYIKSEDGAAYYCNRSESSERQLGRAAIRVTGAPGGKHFAVAWARDPKAPKEPKDPRQDERVTIHTPDGNELHTLPARGDNLLAFTADGKILLAIEPVSALKVTYSCWDVETGKKLSQQTLPIRPGKHDYAFNPDGKDVAVLEHGDGQCLVRLYDAATGKPCLPRVGHQAALTDIVWSPDGQKLATTDVIGSVLVWDPSRSAPVSVHNEVLGKKVDCLHFAPDSQRILAFGMKDGVQWMAYYPAGPGEPEMFDKVRLPSKCAAFSPDGRWLAVGTDDGTVSLWDARKAQEVRVLLAQNAVRAVAFSPDGSELSAGDMAGLHIRWSTRDWKEIRRSSSLDHGIFHLEYLLGGTSIGIGTINERRFQGAFEWHTYSVVEHTIHQERSEPKGFDYLRRPLAISPGMRLFAHHDTERDCGDLLLWQPSASDDHFRRFRYPNPAVAAFSPDGRYLAVGDQAGLVSILRLAERGQVPQLPLVEEQPKPKDGDK
jgi:WD40 repeat protein